MPDNIEHEVTPEKEKFIIMKAIVLEQLGTPEKDKEEDNDYLADKYAFDILMMSAPEMPTTVEISETESWFLSMVKMDIGNQWNNREAIWQLMQEIPDRYPKSPKTPEYIPLVEELRQDEDRRENLISIFVLRRLANNMMNERWKVDEEDSTQGVLQRCYTHLERQIEESDVDEIDANHVLGIVSIDGDFPIKWEECSPEIQKAITDMMKLLSVKYQFKYGTNEAEIPVIKKEQGE